MPEDHTVELISDILWHFYALGGRTVHAMAGLRSRGPHPRMVLALHMLSRFPFASPDRPAYEVELKDSHTEFLTTWSWCLPHAFVRDMTAEQGESGELKALRRCWSSFDWAYNHLLSGVRGGHERPHTMSDGDPCCDMTWQVLDPPKRRQRAG